MMYLPIFWIHRDASNWGPDADAFKPARHLDAESTTKTADGGFRHVAFSGGQRNCVGQRFAMIESTVLFVVLLRKLRFTLMTDEEVVPVTTGVVQKPKNGELWFHITSR